ncbi:MAG TPA: 50S ribosomal protein L4 [Candidatus Paceibacterota bacterium]|nr:50S ribosomal protein L4 [Candidatus Paceibacterota bacterium]
MKADVYNLNNQVIGTVELPDTVFGTRWNATLVKQVMDAQLANARRPWAHVKDRSEVSGGGKKPWRQKGTGRARHGSTRSPIWVHGGKAHGPRNDKDYSQKVNKKMKRVALFSVLSRKAKDGEMKIFETLAVDAPKTKLLATALNAVLSMPKKAKRYDVLLVADQANKNLFRASSNLQKAKAVDANSLNVVDVLNHKNLFIDKNAALSIAKHFGTAK